MEWDKLFVYRKFCNFASQKKGISYQETPIFCGKKIPADAASESR